MYAGKTKEVKVDQLLMEGVKNVAIQWLMSEKEGAKKFAMRLVSIKKGGIIPLHSHAQIHEQYIIRGNGVIFTKDKQRELGPGDFVFLDENEAHGMKNTGDEDFDVICCMDL
ncbi:MAG: cupin domain-containing protein [Thermodesulfobacteriota bacterium]|nr:cupin domain-containing protein [Thermodesulfobacteriota bacterium]